jgi:hypothetical protein
MCLSCGNVACCDSSNNRHATKHFEATGHPIMRSIEPGENWKWCYVDRVMWTRAQGEPTWRSLPPRPHADLHNRAYRHRVFLDGGQCRACTRTAL